MEQEPENEAQPPLPSTGLQKADAKTALSTQGVSG